MQFDIDRDSFAEALSRAAAIATAKDGIPILRNVLLTSKDAGAIELAATDLELTLRTTTPAEVRKPGKVSIPAKQSLDLVRGFLDKRVSVERQSDGRVALRAGKSRRLIPAAPAEDFPLIPESDALAFIACDITSLAHGLSKPLYACPKTEDAWSTAGLFVLPTGEEKTCRVLATDGHRLIYQDIKGGFPLDLPAGGIVLPLKGVQQILRHIEGAEEAFLAEGESRIVLKTPGGVLGVQLLEAEAPDYEAIIPSELQYSLHTDSERLQVHLNSLSPMAQSKQSPVRLHLAEGKLILRLGGQEIGEGEDELDVDYEDDELSVAMNYTYLKEVCRSAGGGPLVMRWIDHVHGVVFTEPANAGALHLIMPMVN